MRTQQGKTESLNRPYGLLNLGLEQRTPRFITSYSLRIVGMWATGEDKR